MAKNSQVLTSEKQVIVSAFIKFSQKKMVLLELLLMLPKTLAIKSQQKNHVGVFSKKLRMDHHKNWY